MMSEEKRPLRSLLPEVRLRIERSLPSFWPELGSLVRTHLTGHPLPPPVILPLASCAAVGGRPQQAIPLAAAWALLLLGLRWLDDVQDQDRPDGLWAQVGVSRAINFGAAALSLSWKALTSAQDEAVPHSIMDLFADAALELGTGQNQDLQGGSTTVRGCSQIIQQKCGTYFALAGRAGALLGTGDARLVDACGHFGEHIGAAIQILDDLEGVFFPKGKGDLALNKVTLPIVYGMTVNHAGRDELRRIVHNRQLAENEERVRELLDSIDTRTFLLAAALQERRQAVDELSSCPGGRGVQALSYFANSLFSGLEDMLPTANDAM